MTVAIAIKRDNRVSLVNSSARFALVNARVATVLTLLARGQVTGGLDASVGLRLDLVLNPNTKNPFLFSWVNPDQAALNYTGSTFKLSVMARNAAGAPTGPVLLTLSTGSGISGTLSAGQFDLLFPKYAAPSTGLPAGEYIYDCLRLESSVAVEPMCWGLIDVLAGITT